MASSTPVPDRSSAGMFRTMVTTWTRQDWRAAGLLLGFIALMHVVGFGLLFLVIGPAHYEVGTKVFGVGLGITAYTFGLRHAFDADHIAAIDNTTRKLRGDGERPKSVGFWFAMGHSTIVAAMAALVAAGTHVAGEVTNDDNAVRQALGIIGTSVSGTFLYLIALINLVALIGIVRVYRSMRRGEHDEERLEEHLQSRGALNRLLGRATRTVTKPWQMYAVGLLFGLGFDTASEIALLVLAGSGAASGIPWYAIMTLPLLFAAGMSLLDCLDGIFMSVAYDWAFLDPLRKVYYNVTVTGLSVAVALVIGTIELVGILHEKAHWDNAVTAWIANLNLDNVGFIVVGLFVATWVVALTYWRVARVEERYAASVRSSGHA